MPKFIDREAKRQKIMKAALELFLKKGYKSVTTREIAAEACISKGILYDYFKNKEDLFHQTVREHIKQTITIKTALEDTTISPMERFQKLVNLCEIDEEQRKKRFHMMFDFIVYCSDNDLVNEIIGSIYDDLRSIVKQIMTAAFPNMLNDSRTVDLYCNIITAYLEGIHFQNFFDPTKARLPQSNELFWKIICEKLQTAAPVPA